MSTITITGAGMMGSAFAFPAGENGNTFRLAGTPLDKEIIMVCRKSIENPCRTGGNRTFPVFRSPCTPTAS